MGDDEQRRFCDLIAGAASAGVVVALAAGTWRGALVSAGVVVAVLLVRSGV